MEDIYLGITIGFGLAAAIVYYIMDIKNKFKEMDRNIEMLVDITEGLDNKIPTAETMAREVLKVKLPLSEMPPEILAEIKQKMDKKKENIGKIPKPPIESYTG